MKSITLIASLLLISLTRSEAQSYNYNTSSQPVRRTFSYINGNGNTRYEALKNAQLAAARQGLLIYGVNTTKSSDKNYNVTLKVTPRY